MISCNPLAAQIDMYRDRPFPEENWN